MSELILVTGSTGRLGRHVVSELREYGAEIRTVSRSEQAGRDHLAVDLRADDGLRRALNGVATVVHCAGGRRGDEALAKRLLRSAREAGVDKFVTVSVVGSEAAGSYGAQKLRVERAVAESGIPWSLQRATQFFDFVAGGIAGLAKLPVLLVPRDFPSRPIDARDLAEKVAALALAAPAGRVPDLGGPEVLTFAELAQLYLQATGIRRRVIELPIGSAAIREGAMLPTDEAGPPVAGGRTWRDWLAEHVEKAGHG
jgi:uncharacterized protein YbjT (DUF2867 family)